MIGQATAHRRANAFAQALESAGTRSTGVPEHTGDRTADAAGRRADPQQERLLSMASALAGVPRPELDAEVRTLQRARLIAAMEAGPAEDQDPSAGRVPEQRGLRGTVGTGRRRAARPRGSWSRRLAAGGLTVGVAAGAFSGVAAASTNALPGDTLYGLKRGMEDLRLGMAEGDTHRGKLLLDMASTRMQETRRLIERRPSGGLGPETVREVRGALLSMHHEASTGHQLLSAAYRQEGSIDPIEALNAFSEHRLTWTVLRHQLPSELDRLGAQVSSVFDAIEREVAPLKDLLSPTGSGERPAGTAGTGRPDGAGGTHGRPVGPSAAGSPGTAEHGAGQAEGGSAPASPTTSGQGLIGGSELLGTASGGGRTPGHGPSAGAGPASGGTTQPGVSLPPLLPSLLPDLGIAETDSGR